MWRAMGWALPRRVGTTIRCVRSLHALQLSPLGGSPSPSSASREIHNSIGSENGTGGANSFQVHLGFVTDRLDVHMEEPFVLQFIQVHCNAHAYEAIKHRVHKNRQTGHGYVHFSKLSDAVAAMKILKGNRICGVTFDCALVSPSNPRPLPRMVATRTVLSRVNPCDAALGLPLSSGSAFGSPSELESGPDVYLSPPATSYPMLYGNGAVYFPAAYGEMPFIQQVPYATAPGFVLSCSPVYPIWPPCAPLMPAASLPPPACPPYFTHGLVPAYHFS